MKEKGLKLNVILYNTLLAMCADVGYTDEAVEIFEEMKSSETLKPDSWTFSSMITMYSCSGKAKRTDDVVKIFNQLLELGITPDERFCGCLLNVMTQTPKEELCKLVNCIERADEKLGYVLKLLVEKQESSEKFKNETSQLFNSIGSDVKKAYSNCLIDLCVNLNLLERASLTALHVWINDLSRVLESGEELLPLLGINTGYGKLKYSNKGLAGVF
ncbi:hypothetical protein ACFX2J_005378 [Malus domestica]